MGTRSGSKIKLRTPKVKCDICGRLVLSQAALKSHQQSVHGNASKTPKTVTKPKMSVNAKQTVKHTAKPHKIVKPVQQMVKKVYPSSKMSKALVKKVAFAEKPAAKAKEAAIVAKDKVASNGQVAEVVASDRTDFECPVCFKRFPQYFHAHRHLLKTHKTEMEEKKLTPTRIAKCITCNLRVKSTEMHVCDETEDLGAGLHVSKFKCCACNQMFVTLRNFDLHVGGLHNEGVESMFFPTEEEFQAWKHVMEMESEARYSIIGKYSSKHIYRCMFTPLHEDKDEDCAQFCPSIIIVQKFSKGIQAHFYKHHYGHKTQPKEYVLSDVYKKYSISIFIKQVENYEDILNVHSEENDLYMQFKTLMESIVVNAAKINVDSLKELIVKAFDMTTMLKNYNEDDDVESTRRTLNLTINKKNMSEEQIERELLEFKKIPLKRQYTNNKVENAKKSKQDDVFDVKSDEEDKPIMPFINKNLQSPNFHDSYKDFVDKTLSQGTAKAALEKPMPRCKKQNFKTKIGQYNPNRKSDSPKRTESTLTTVKIEKYEVMEQENDCNILILKI